MSKGYRRKKFFFKDSPQGKYILSYFTLAGLVTILFTILFMYFSSDVLSIKYDNYNLKLGQTPEILMDMILSIHGILIFVCGLAIIYFATHFTHRTAGPIFKISQTIETMTSGDINVHIFLRKHDEYKNIAEKINQFNAVLYKKIKELETISQDLDAHVQKNITGKELDHQAQGTGSPDQLITINEAFKSSLSFFNLSGDLPPE
ncbi:MAG: methyl-accepting chemotaxis protein [Proteobacteria bacterium]|nr:methyl-accepting chemotaxis protein [Pseudomonadota bacterium]